MFEVELKIIPCITLWYLIETECVAFSQGNSNNLFEGGIKSRSAVCECMLIACAVCMYTHMYMNKPDILYGVLQDPCWSFSF